MRLSKILCLNAVFIYCNFSISCKNDDLRYGYTVSQRKSICAQITEAAYRAQADAEAYYPYDIQDDIAHGRGDRPTNDRLFEEATTKYATIKDSIRRSYYLIIANNIHITEDQLDSIAIEGLDKHWYDVSK